MIDDFGWKLIVKGPDREDTVPGSWIVVPAFVSGTCFAIIMSFRLASRYLNCFLLSRAVTLQRKLH